MGGCVSQMILSASLMPGIEVCGLGQRLQRSVKTLNVNQLIPFFLPVFANGCRATCKLDLQLNPTDLWPVSNFALSIVSNYLRVSIYGESLQRELDSRKVPTSPLQFFYSKPRPSKPGWSFTNPSAYGSVFVGCRPTHVAQVARAARISFSNAR